MEALQGVEGAAVRTAFPGRGGKQGRGRTAGRPEQADLTDASKQMDC